LNYAVSGSCLSDEAFIISFDYKIFFYFLSVVIFMVGQQSIWSLFSSLHKKPLWELGLTVITL